MRIARFLVLGLTVVVSAEVTARIEDRLRAGTPLMADPSDRDLVIRDEYGIRGRPNARYKKWHLNSFGFRNDAMSAAPEPGCTRVMVLGASESFGLYESEGKEYPRQLSSVMNRHGCFEVVNAAIAGITVRTIGSFWEHWASRFRPAVVVVYPTPAFYLANARPAESPVPGPVKESVETPVRWWQPRIRDRALDVLVVPPALQRLRVQRWLEDARRGRPSSWMFETLPQERLDDFLHDTESLLCKVAATGARPIVMTHANAFHDPPRPEEHGALEAWNNFTPRATSSVLLQFEREAAKGVRELGAAHGISVVDAARHMYGRREWFARDYFHFTDDGARAVAELIAAELVKEPQSPEVRTAHTCETRALHAVQ